MNESDTTAGPTRKEKVANSGGRTEFVYRRRRVSKGRRPCKADATASDVSDPKSDNKSNTSSQRLERLMDRLYKGNNLVRRMLEETDLDAGLAEKIRESELLISKMRKEYKKIEKNHEGFKEERQRLTDLLVTREADCRRLSLRCKTLENSLKETEETKLDLLASNQSWQAENVRCNQDVMLLKNLVYSLNCELERYQDKLWQRVEKSEENAATRPKEQERIVSSWGGVEFHALAPLLNAYQENLLEKQELLMEYEQQLVNFGGRCKDVIAENERLHREVGELESKCNRYENEIADLADSLASLRKENASLLKEALSRKKNNQEIQWSYERHAESILERNDALQKEHLKITAELNDLRGRYDVLSKQYEKVKDKEEKTVPLSLHTAALEECKTLLEELKHRYETEQKKLCEQIKRAEETQPENENRLAAITAERNHLKALTKTLEKNLKRLQRRVESTQNALHRVQLSRDALKGQLSRTTAYCGELFSEYERAVTEREKLADLLRETEKENASIDRLGKNLTDRMNGLKDQLRVVQHSANQQVATVEKRIKQQEARVSRIKREYRLKVRRLNKLIKQRENTSANVQGERKGAEERENKNSRGHRERV